MSASVLAAAGTQPKQTGPRTQEGKERASGNATTHGGTSRKLIVAGETQSDFDALLNGLAAEYRPDTPQSELFVEQLALAHWFLRRRQRAYSAIESSVYENQPDEAQWTEEHLKRLSLADRYRTQAERALRRALSNVEVWRRKTRSEAVREVQAGQWAAAQALRERRMTLQEEKFKLSRLRWAERAFRFAKNGSSSPLPAEAGIEIVDSRPDQSSGAEQKHSSGERVAA
jgi:hypothetical protein